MQLPFQTRSNQRRRGRATDGLVYAGIIQLEEKCFVHLFFDKQIINVQDSMPNKTLIASLTDTL
jgi:hypothetical protein